MTSKIFDVGTKVMVTKPYKWKSEYKRQMGEITEQSPKKSAGNLYWVMLKINRPKSDIHYDEDEQGKDIEQMFFEEELERADSLRKFKK